MYFNRKNAEQKNWRMIKKGKHFLFGCSLVFAVGASLATQVVHANMAEETTVESGSKAKEAKSGYGGEVGTYEAPAVAEIKPEVATTPAVAAKLGGETAKEVKALDKTKLEKYIVEIEAKLANGTYERKTEESVAVLKADLEAAKATLENATTQDEITKAYNKLVTTANTKLKNKPVKKKETPAVDTTNGQPTVGKKAENTEKKSESNSIENTGSNDPRNGKALDKNNAFRAEIAYNIDSTGNDYGKKDSVITSGIRGSSEAGNAITAVNSVMKYRARYNADATGKITSVDWQVFFNDHLQNFANDYGVKNEVFRNYIQIPNEVNMPTDIRRLQYRAEMKFVDRKYQLVGGDGTGLSDTVSFDNPTPDTAAGRALAKNENLKINGNWDNYTRGLDTLYNNTSFYYKDAVKDEISDTKNLVNSNALQGNRVIYDNANTGGNYRDGYVWEFTTTVPDTVTNEQLKNMKVSMGMLSTGTAGVDHGFHRIAENPVNLSKADVTPPTVKTQTVKVDEQPKAENSIANFKELPAGTKAEFKTPVDTATPGEKTATAVVTYPDTSTKEVPVKVIVEKEAVAPAKPVITTSLAGKANTKTPVEVKAEAGSTVSLFAHDGTKLGSAVANDQGVASITPTVDIPAGIVAATAIKNGKTSEVSDPVEATPAADAATNNPVAPTAPTTPAVAPTVEIPYSDKATKEVYVYGGEENSFDIKFKDDSGKIASAIVNGGGNQPFNPVAGEANTINTQYGFKANVISAETPATADAPAVITYRGIPAATDGLSQDKLDAATKGENPKGMALGWRYATATDTDGAKIENGAVGSSNATDPGSFRVMLKPQTQKYDITIPAETEKVVVANPAAVTDAEFAKVKEKLKIEFSKTNNDANLAKDQGKNVEDKDAKIKTIEKVGNDLVVTYKDGSVDKKSLTEFVRTNEKPTVEIQYSDPAPNKKEVYVYASEVNSFDIKIKDDSGKLASAELRRGSNQEFKDVAGETNKQDTQYGFTANKFTSETTATAENPAVITYTGTPAPEGAFTKEKFEKAIQDGGTPLGWRFVKAIDKDGEDARGNGRDATDPTAVNVILKPQTQKYDIKTPAEADKVVVSDVNNVTDKEFEKIKEKVKLEYSQNNPDARLADKKGTEVENPADRIASITKDGNDVVVTYKDGSKDKKPLSEFVTKKPTDADKNEPTAKTQTVNKGTTPKAEDSIGNVKDLPKGTTVAFKAPVDTTTPGEKDATVVVTYPDGSTEEVPVKVTVKDPSSTPDTEAPAKPNAGNDVVKPADKTVVANPEKLTDAEKKAIEDKVKAVNPGSTVVVDDKGNATVTTPEGKTAVIPATDLTKSEADEAKPNAGNDVNTPAAKTVVANPDKLTDAEKKAIEDKVKAVNPGATVVVDDKGNATVTTPEGKTAVIPATDLVKTQDDITKENAGNDVNTPAAKTVVANPDKLTDAEKKAIEDKVKAVNPGSTVVVDDKGNATVAKGDGTVLNIPALDLVIPADDLVDAAKNTAVKTPAIRTLVADKEKLTDAEKAAVKKAIEAVNPGATVVVDDKGNATVTLDGNTVSIAKDQLVKTASDVTDKNSGDNINLDFEKETVADLNNLTDAEKEAAKAKIKGANADVVEVIFDKAGNATVVTKDGKVLAIAAEDIFKQRPSAPNSGGNGTSGNNGTTNTDVKVDKAKLEGAIRQLDELIIKESAKLDAETVKEANDLLADAKKVFANADASQAEVDAMVKRIEDFMAKVAPSTDHATPANDQAAQTPAVAPATTQAAANASQTASAQANARKAAKELPNTGTADSTVAMVAAAASALLGLGLAGRRRKEDEEA